MTTGKRRRAREMATQMLYQREIGGSSLEEIFRHFDLEVYREEIDSETSGSGSERSQIESAFRYACHLVEGIVNHEAMIDGLLRRHAANWRLSRMPTIDRNILRLALFEMLEADVPWPSVMDEAIAVAKRFGTERSGRFVNGVLDAIFKSDEATRVLRQSLEVGEPS